MDIMDAVALLKRERDLGLSSRFPCRVIIVNTVQEYNQLMAALVHVCDRTISVLDDEYTYIPGQDVLPNYTSLAKRIEAECSDKWFLIPSTGEYLKLFTSFEKKNKRLYDLWHLILPSESKCRIILPMWGCVEQWDHVGFFDDERQEDFIIKAGFETDIDNQMRIQVLSDDFETVAKHLSEGEPVYGIRDWLALWERSEVDPEKRDYTILTKRWKLIDNYTGTVSIAKQTDQYTFIRSRAADGELLKKEWCGNDALALILPSIAQGRTIKKAILDSLNMLSFSLQSLLTQWMSMTTGSKELGYAYMRISPNDGSYAWHCFNKADSVDKIPDMIENEIFELYAEKPSWIKESQVLITYLGRRKSPAYFAHLECIPDFETRLQFLSSKTTKERAYIIQTVGHWIKEAKPDMEWLCELLAKIYPAFANYLNPNCAILSDSRYVDLIDYLNKYKMYKLQGSVIPEDQEEYTERVIVSKFPYRYAAVSECVEENTMVLWIDALGAEWVSLLTSELSTELKDAHIESVSVAQATLPTETMYNEGWKDYQLPYEKLDKLDKLAHKGVIDEPSYYDCVEAQIAFMKEIAKKVQEKIHNYNKIIITGDHGTSRLAALAFHQLDAKTPPKDAQVKSHGRYCLVKNYPSYMDTIWEKASANDVKMIVIKSYDHFTQPGNAAGENNDEITTYGEVHGGATPEESLVPVIVIKNEHNVFPIKVQLMPNVVVREGSSKSVTFCLNFDRPVHSLRLMKPFENASIQADSTWKSWHVKIENAKLGKWNVKMEANSIITDGGQLEIKAGGLVMDDDFFGDF